MSGLKKLIHEIHRRSLWQVLGLYIGGSFVVLQVLDALGDTIGLPEWFAAVAVGLLIVGLPIVLATAFVQEGLGPQRTPLPFSETEPGAELQTSPDPGSTPEGVSGGVPYRLLTWRNALTGGVFAFALWGIVAAGWILLGDGPGSGETDARAERSIAVLPFTNMSPEPENEYFSDGITEEIISKLARIEGLQVASRTSVMRFKNSDEDLDEIASKLAVRYVLEGSVRRAGDRVRITAQLIESESNFHLWSEDFDGSLDDIFDVQERTAIQIAGALDLELSPAEERAVRRRYTDNSEAYDEFLQGWAHAQFFADRDRLQAASEHFERALSLEPDYAPALAGLAMVEALTYRDLDPSEDRLRRADRQVSRALELDPELVAAHSSMGMIAGARYEYEAAEESFREAIRLDDTDPFAWDLLSWALGYQQPPRAVEAEQAAREAIRLDPDFIYAFYHLGRALLLQERPEEAIEAFRRIEEVVPGSRLGYIGIAQGYLAAGQFAEAEEAAIEVGRGGVTAVGMVVHASALAAQGKYDEALVQLERALSLNYRDFEALENSPYLAALREDPRFTTLLDRYRE